MKTDIRKGLAILLFFLAVYSLVSIGHYGGDGYQDYITAESIVLDGNLTLYDRPEDKDDLKYLSDLGVEGRDGKIYSSRSILGMPFLLAPFYFVGDMLAKFLGSVPHDYVTMLFVSFANPVFLAFSCLLIFGISRQFGYTDRTSSIVSIVFGLCTMTPVYGRTGFSGAAVVLFLLLSIYSIFKYEASLKIRYVVLAAIALSAMFYCKAASLIFFVCFLIYLIWLLKDSSLSAIKKAGHFILFAGILTSAVCLAMIVNYHIYGNALSFGQSNALELGKRIAGAPHVLKGFYYYLVSTGKGFLLFNIPVIFALIASRRACLKDKKKAVLFFLIFLVNLFFYVKSFRRGSLFSWGPRYLLPSVGPLLIMCGSYIEDFKGVLQRIVFIIGSVVAFFIMLPCMFINQSKFYFFVVEKLGLNEYMINFIPDLSPIKGAWIMLFSRLQELCGFNPMPFVYDPDYRLVEPVSAFMDKYNYLDLWVLKTIEKAPDYTLLVYGAAGLLIILDGFSLYNIFSER